LLLLIRRLLQKNRSTNLSYDNLVGNFKDGEIGKKVRNQIFTQFFSIHNPEREFAEYMFNFDKHKIFPTDAILEEKFLESHLHIVKDMN
jgi:hypothetical protein